MTTSHVLINSPGVVHEMVDGEVVIVNLDNGLYFSTDEMGAAVWARIADHQPIESIVDWATATFDLSIEAIRADIVKFVRELEEHQLVVPTDAPGSSNGNGAQAPTPRTYTPPELQVYSDMEELLLLDPVHDVGDEGWPHAP